jgi:hypothetical protein
MRKKKDYIKAIKLYHQNFITQDIFYYINLYLYKIYNYIAGDICTYM